MSTRAFRLRFGTNAVGAGHGHSRQASPLLDYGLEDPESFACTIVVERKRTERSGNPFLLMLLEADVVMRPVSGGREFLWLVSTLKSNTRETDTIGWHNGNSVIGVIFTEVGAGDEATQAAILTKITQALQEKLGPMVNRLRISLHRYPNNRSSGPGGHEWPFYPDLQRQNAASKVSHIVKRTMDVVGSALALVVLSPIFVVIALAIKLNSRGPILFKQTRVGQQGIPFTFLKFRSMFVNNDPGIHREYVSRFISGEDGLKHPAKNDGGGVYKITNDPRVTKVGRLLRKTSLDELPQLANVLKGEMSLVGPRPPLPYEFERYDTWHRRRIFEVKPGITGLWQVNGRSRTNFSEMVRLDLRYATRWSLWLDLRILMQTPKAVLFGDGAY
jgi:lipopolysaccharide/colanic/teichoic acid biosynthesis glycosyltransferase